MAIRPRRSMLYVPGSNARAIEKARTLASDGIIFDLEDSVALDAKPAAREAAAAALAARGFGNREVVVRINSLDTPFGLDDLDAVCRAGPDAILVPKISTPADVARAGEQLDKRDSDHKIALWLMIETPLGIINVKDIAASAKSIASRLGGFVMGTNDLAKEMRVSAAPDRAPLITLLSMAVLAARAYGLTILDGVYNNVRDSEGFATECRQGAALGFDGKTLIHPSQIAPCNLIFRPKDKDIEWARRVIAAFERPENAAKGAIELDGKMIERLHAEESRRLVILADAIAAADAAR